jgi:hypothetical protein
LNKDELTLIIQISRIDKILKEGILDQNKELLTYLNENEIKIIKSRGILEFIKYRKSKISDENEPVLKSKEIDILKSYREKVRRLESQKNSLVRKLISINSKEDLACIKEYIDAYDFVTDIINDILGTTSEIDLQRRLRKKNELEQDCRYYNYVMNSSSSPKVIDNCEKKISLLSDQLAELEHYMAKVPKIKNDNLLGLNQEVQSTLKDKLKKVGLDIRAINIQIDSIQNMPKQANHHIQDLESQLSKAESEINSLKHDLILLKEKRSELRKVNRTLTKKNNPAFFNRLKLIISEGTKNKIEKGLKELQRDLKVGTSKDSNLELKQIRSKINFSENRIQQLNSTKKVIYNNIRINKMKSQVDHNMSGLLDVKSKLLYEYNSINLLINEPNLVEIAISDITNIKK